MPQLIASVEGVEIKHVYLQKDRTTLGRAPDNDIVFDNLVVSGHHCVFELKGLADVFVEDLRSTNGTYINGKMVKRQQLQDGDVIAIGNFRVLYKEATERPSGFGETAAMKIGPDGLPRQLHAVFQVLNGSSAGLEMPVVKAVTTFGKPGTCVVAVSHRREGFFVAHLDGAEPPSLNGDRLAADPVMLSNHDVVEIAGTRMLFQLKGMKFIRKMFGDSKPSPRSSFPSSVVAETSVEQTKSRNAPRRELVRVTLRETMRRHGIPGDWMDCRTLSVLTRQHKPGMHVQFLVRKADHQILPWVHAFQESFWEQILRTDAHAKEWLFSVGWEFYGHSEQGFDRMPGAGNWRSEPDTQAMEGDTQPPESAQGEPDEDSKEDIASDLQMLQALITQPAELTEIPDTPRPAKR